MQSKQKEERNKEKHFQLCENINKIEKRLARQAKEKLEYTNYQHQEWKGGYYYKLCRHQMEIKTILPATPHNTFNSLDETGYTNYHNSSMVQ